MEPLPYSHRVLKAFLSVFFKLLYHQFSWAYDFVAASVSLGRWKSWVLTTLPYLPGPRVLEIGHGPGHLQVALGQRGIQSIGLDESKQMGRLALYRIRRSKGFPLLVNGYAQFLPFPTDLFDQVVATFPSEYIYSLNTLGEIYRVLKPKGTLIILPLAWISGKSLLDRLAAWLFHITDQAPEWHQKMEEPFRLTGFIVHTSRLELDSSTLLLIVGQKSSPAGSHSQ